MLLSFVYFNDYPFWWLIVCFFISLIYALILYPQKYFFENKKLVTALFLVRLLIVFILCLLLLNPLVKVVNQKIEKPIIVLALDESKSIKPNKDKSEQLIRFEAKFKALQKELSKNFDVKILSFGAYTKDDWPLTYQDNETNFENLFQFIENNYGNKNIGATIIASDGIINKGSDLLQKTTFSVYTIPLGDTVPVKDISINKISINPTVSLENSHEIKVQVFAKGLMGIKTKVIIKTSDGQVIKQPISINNNNYFTVITSNIQSKKKGLQKIVANIPKIKQEKFIQNNTKYAFTNVIENKINILLYSNSPHPDLSAIKACFKNSRVYKVTLSSNMNELDEKKYDVVIFYQTPNKSQKDKNVLNTLKLKPKLFFLGQQTDINAIHQSTGSSNINVQSVAYNYPIINSEFHEFGLSKQLMNTIPVLPPILQTHNLRIGNQIIKTKNQFSSILNLVNNPDARIAFFNGEGFWKWRLKDFEINHNFLVSDELLNKTIQWLVTNNKDEDKNFRVKPINPIFTTTEKVVFDASFYNQASQPVNEPEIKLELKGNSKQYSYIFSKLQNNGYFLEAGYLPKGSYVYKANTIYNGAKFYTSGEFVVEENFAEIENTTTNTSFLKSLAETSGGKMIYPENINEIKTMIEKNSKIKPLFFEDLKYNDLINLKFILFLILSLLSLEWFVRKRNSLV